MKRRKNLRLLMTSLICGSLLAGSQVGSAEELVPTFQLDEIVVTATRTMEEAKKVPAVVHVITSEDIKKKNIKTISDALTMLPGVYNGRTHGMSESANGITIRGFDENNILFLYDGMVMNDAYSGSMNWNAISVDDVERIEIVQGAASSLYGGHAVAAVVNIIGKDPEKDSIRAYASYGTKNTWKRGLNLSKKLSDKWSMGIGYEHKRTSGWQKKYAYVSPSKAKSPTPSGTVATGAKLVRRASGSEIYLLGTPGTGASRDDTYNFKLKYKFTDDQALTYRFTHDKYRYFSAKPQSWLTDSNGKAIFEGSVKFKNGKYYNFDESDFTDYDGKREVDRHAWQYKNEKNKIDLNIGFTNVKKSEYATGSDLAGKNPGNNTANPSKTYKLDFQKVWEMNKNTIVAGFDAQKDSMTYQKLKLAHWHDHNSVTSETSRMGGRAQNIAAFIQDRYKFNDNVAANLGIRWDHYKKYDGFYSDSKSYINHAEGTYNELSPKLSFEFTPNTDTTFYVSYGHSFNPPRLYQMFRYDVINNYIPNPNLKPETTNTFEAGIKKKFNDRTFASATFYQAKTSDMITYIKINDKGTKQYVNLKKATRLGVESELTHKFSNELSCYLNYAYENAKDDNDERIWWIPKHTMHMGVTYDKEKWNAFLEGQYVSRRDEPSYLGKHYMADDAFFTANLGINYKITPQAMVSFSVDNLFDRDYWQWYKALGRVYTIGVQFEF